VDLPELVGADIALVPRTIEIELQLTTQLQEIVYKLTHEVYTAVRHQEHTDRDRWKWEYKTRRFRAGYLGHTLHMLEGLIAEMRDSAQSDKADVVTTSTEDGDGGDSTASSKSPVESSKDVLDK
jgi:hypothetical protein